MFFANIFILKVTQSSILTSSRSYSGPNSLNQWYFCNLSTNNIHETKALLSNKSQQGTYHNGRQVDAKQEQPEERFDDCIEGWVWIQLQLTWTLLLSYLQTRNDKNSPQSLVVSVVFRDSQVSTITDTKSSMHRSITWMQQILLLALLPFCVQLSCLFVLKNNIRALNFQSNIYTVFIRVPLIFS